MTILKIKRFFLALSLLFFLESAFAAIINVTPESHSVCELNSAIASASSGDVFEFASGDYYYAKCSNNPNGHIFIENGKTGIVFKGNDGGGVTRFFFEDNKPGFKILNSSDITIKNIEIEYHTLPFTQGVIKDVGSGFAIVEIHQGYPDVAMSGQTTISQTKVMVVDYVNDGNPDGYDSASSRYIYDWELADGFNSYNNRAVEFQYDASSLVDYNPDRSYIKVFAPFPSSAMNKYVRVNLSDKAYVSNTLQQHAFHIKNSRSITLENCKIYSCSGFGVLEEDSGDTYYNNVDMVPGEPFELSPEDEIEDLSEDRLGGVNRDGFHIVRNDGELNLIDCDVFGSGDDGLNISDRMGIGIDFIVKYCSFQNVFSRGLLIRGEDGVISNNKIFKCTNGGIVLTNNSTLGYPGDIEIYDNELSDIGFMSWYNNQNRYYGGIYVGQASDIKIMDNEFSFVMSANLRVSTSSVISVSGNTFENLYSFERSLGQSGSSPDLNSIAADGSVVYISDANDVYRGCSILVEPVCQNSEDPECLWEENFRNENSSFLDLYSIYPNDDILCSGDCHSSWFGWYYSNVIGNGYRYHYGTSDWLSISISSNPNSFWAWSNNHNAWLWFVTYNGVETWFQNSVTEQWFGPYEF